MYLAMRMGRPLCWPRSQKWPYFSYPPTAPSAVLGCLPNRINLKMSLIFAHRVGSLKELWDVPCPSPTGEPFGPRGGVVPTRSAREALRALLLDVVSIQ